MNTKKSMIGLLVTVALFWGCGQSGESDGDTWYEQGEYQKAVEAYGEHLKTKPKDVEALYRRGRALEELGDLEAAKTDFEAGIKQDPKNLKLLLSLSNLYQKEKNHERALLYADYAVNVSGAPATAYFLKGRALHQLGNTEEAMKEYDTAIKMDKNYGQAYYYRGILKYATKDKKGACADFRKSSDLNHTPADEALQKYCQ